MKYALLVAALMFSFPAASRADENPFAAFQIHKTCADRILVAAQRQCNQDSKNDPSREHECVFWGQVQTKGNSDTRAFFSIDFTVTDADDYWIPVYLFDKATCQFKIYKAESN